MISRLINTACVSVKKSLNTSSIEFIFFSMLLVVLLFLNQHLNVDAGYLPILDEGTLGNIPNPTDITTPTDGVDRLENTIGAVLRNARFIIGAVAIGILVYAGGILVLRGEDEGEVTKQKSTITFVIVGMALIGVSGAVSELLSAENGGFLNPETAKERAVGFRVEVNLIITFIKYILGSMATLFIVTNSLRLITGGGDESAVTEVKQKLAASTAGLMIIIFSTVFIDKVFYVVNLNSPDAGSPQIDATQGVRELIAITNIVVTVIGPILIIMLVAGGFMYILSAGDDGKIDKAKALIKNAVIGIIVVYGAFAVVSTFISGSI